MNYFIVGSIFGMITVFKLAIKGTAAFKPIDLGPTGELLVGAFIGSILYGAPLWVLDQIMASM